MFKFSLIRNIDYYISALTSIDLTVLLKRIVIHFCLLLIYSTHSTKPNIRVEDDRLYYLFSLIFASFHFIFFIKNLGLEFSIILYNTEKNVEQ